MTQDENPVLRRGQDEARRAVTFKDQDAFIHQLQEKERTFRAAMEHSPIGMALTAMNGTWIDVNPALCDLLGYSKQELMQVGFKNVTHPDDRQATIILARKMVASRQKSVALEKRYIHANGQMLTGILNLTVVRDDAGEPVMYISQIRDVTLARQLEQLKSEFIATVNHELRTPLTGIIGSLTLMEKLALEGRTDRGNKLLSIAYRNAMRLKSLLDDVLELETLRLDNFETLAEDVDLTELVERVVLLNADMAVASSVEILCNIPKESLTCPSDRDKITRIFQVLVSNAIKFSSKGGMIHINLTVTAGSLRFSISNQGIEIPQAMQEAIFQPFVQADDTMTRRNEGAGLGLAIAKHLVDSLGAQIGCESGPAETRFWVDFPYDRRH